MKLHDLIKARAALQAEWDEKFSELVALDEAIKNTSRLINFELTAEDNKRGLKLMEVV